MTVELELIPGYTGRSSNAEAELPFFGYLCADDPVRQYLSVKTEIGTQRIPLWAERGLGPKLVFKRLLHAITTPFHERPYDLRSGGTHDPLFSASIRISTVLGTDQATLAVFDPAKFVEDNHIIERA